MPLGRAQECTDSGCAHSAGIECRLARFAELSFHGFALFDESPVDSWHLVWATSLQVCNLFDEPGTRLSHQSRRRVQLQSH